MDAEHEYEKYASHAYEIHVRDEHIAALRARCEKAEAENKRLREALEFAQTLLDLLGTNEGNMKKIRAALSETE